MGEDRVVKAGRPLPLTSVVTVVSKVVSRVLRRQKNHRQEPVWEGVLRKCLAEETQ